MEGPEVVKNDDFERAVNVLVEMGFPKENAEAALLKFGINSIDLAADYLVNNDSPTHPVESTDDEWEDAEYNYKMVFVVNTDLKMSIGKTAAQVAHGCLGLYKDLEEKPEYCESKDGLKEWLEEGQKKIVLSGKNAEQLLQLQEIARSSNVPNHIIRDAGHTEIAAGSITVLALFGAEEDVNRITGSLRLLK